MEKENRALEVAVWADGTHVCLSNPYAGDTVIIDPKKLCEVWRQMQEVKEKIIPVISSEKGKSNEQCIQEYL